MNSQHLRIKWNFEKLDKYGPYSTVFPFTMTALYSELESTTLV